MFSIIVFVFRLTFSCLILYMLCYTLLEDALAKRMKETPFLKLKCISNRIISLAFLCGSVKGIVVIFRIMLSLLASKTPSRHDIISAILLSFVLILTIYYRKRAWYFLTKKTRVIFCDWYMNKYLAQHIDEENTGQKYEYLQKASELKPDVFIWSMMALFNQCFFDKPDLADEYVVKAQQILNNSEQPSQKDKATLESARGEILLRRDNIDEGLAHLKTACDLDPSGFHKEKYERALKWANEDDEPENSV